MDIVDQELSRAERDASPDRFPDSFPIDAPKNSEQIHSPQIDAAKVEKRDTATSLGSTASSSSASVVRESIGMSRVNTQRDLDRHPTELDRIETHRTQHGSTVGRTHTSRKSKKPLPNFGGGKECKGVSPFLLETAFRAQISKTKHFQLSEPVIMDEVLTLKCPRPSTIASTGRICCRV